MARHLFSEDHKMKEIHFQIGITLDGDAAAALAALMQQAVEKRTVRFSQETTKPSGNAESNSESKRPMTPIERSHHAMLGGQKPPENMGLLLTTKEAAKLMRVSDRTLWGWSNDGKMPKPLRIGQSVRYSYEELRAWTNAGCPMRAEWKYSPES
jgi:excisionase family DNA binding protein